MKNLISSMASNKAIDLGVKARVENLLSIWPSKIEFEAVAGKTKLLWLLGMFNAAIFVKNIH